MTAARTSSGVFDQAAAERSLAEETASPSRSWSSGPGDRFGWHAHPMSKVLFCVRGQIVFHTREGDVSLAAGDRLDLDAGTPHAATVGPDGCACVEAWRT